MPVSKRTSRAVVGFAVLGIAVASFAIILGVPPTVGEPALEFPIREVNGVKYLRSYGIANWSGPGTHHNGIDLAINQSVTIIAPVKGTIISITSKQNPNNPLHNILYSIDILVNWGWRVSLVLEPMFNGNDTANNALQQSAIKATFLQRVEVGQEVASLLYAGTGVYSHLHYMLSGSLGGDGGDACPYTYSSATARASFDVIAARSTDLPCVPIV
jgi:hypothetical protein